MKHSRSRPTPTWVTSPEPPRKSVQKVLDDIESKKFEKIAVTIQGSIWRSTDISTPSVIKVVNKDLHANGQGVVHGVRYSIGENIIKEQAILRYLNQRKDCPKTIIKCGGFYESNTLYYLLMEDGGNSLFSFVKKAHEFIKRGDIEISEWKKLTKIIANQMIDSIHYLHSKNICHFDISLENFVINDVGVDIQDCEGQKHKLTFDLSDVRVKLCDFGLSEMFATSWCKSTKTCGKAPYKSPEVLSEESFDAKKNDVWSLGVSLFMLISGTPPWGVPDESDEIFRFVSNYSLTKLLKLWHIFDYFDNASLWLLHSIFRNESDRIDIDRLKQYSRRFM